MAAGGEAREVRPRQDEGARLRDAFHIKLRPDLELLPILKEMMALLPNPMTNSLVKDGAAERKALERLIDALNDGADPSTLRAAMLEAVSGKTATESWGFEDGSVPAADIDNGGQLFLFGGFLQKAAENAARSDAGKGRRLIRALLLFDAYTSVASHTTWISNYSRREDPANKNFYLQVAASPGDQEGFDKLTRLADEAYHNQIRLFNGDMNRVVNTAVNPARRGLPVDPKVKRDALAKAVVNLEKLEPVIMPVRGDVYFFVGLSRDLKQFAAGDAKAVASFDASLKQVRATLPADADPVLRRWIDEALQPAEPFPKPDNDDANPAGGL